MKIYKNIGYIRDVAKEGSKQVVIKIGMQQVKIYKKYGYIRDVAKKGVKQGVI